MDAMGKIVGETQEARAEFLSIPILVRALDGDVPLELYVQFLNQAYHHVRHTCPLLSLAAAMTDDDAYRAALFTYLKEEEGHERWILSDIAAMRGGIGHVSVGPPRRPCHAMVGYAYYAIQWISPYALLGMIHVLESLSEELAARAATILEESIGTKHGGGFSYLVSHGALDGGHTAFFSEVVNLISEPSADVVIIDCARMMYWLYGNIFRDLAQMHEKNAHVARR